MKWIFEAKRHQISDYLYREIRIENKLTDENGSQVRLKPEAEVEVTVEAEPEATVAAQSDEGVQNAPREKMVL